MLISKGYLLFFFHMGYFLLDTLFAKGYGVEGESSRGVQEILEDESNGHTLYLYVTFFVNNKAIHAYLSYLVGHSNSGTRVGVLLPCLSLSH